MPTPLRSTRRFSAGFLFQFPFSLLAGPSLLVGSTASAQTSVSIYGIVDAGIVSEHGGAAGPVNKRLNGVGSTSRPGFKGSEDTSGGATMQLASYQREGDRTSINQDANQLAISALHAQSKRTRLYTSLPVSTTATAPTTRSATTPRPAVVTAPSAPASGIPFKQPREKSTCD